MDSLFADFMAVMGRFFDERLTKLADERAAAVVPKAREGLATQSSVDALAKQVADLSVALPAAVKPLATKVALAAAIEPLAPKSALTALATKAEVETAKQAAITAATNGRPNRSEMNTAIKDAKAEVDAKIAEIMARLDALTPPGVGA